MFIWWGSWRTRLWRGSPIGWGLCHLVWTWCWKAYIPQGRFIASYCLSILCVFELLLRYQGISLWGRGVTSHNILRALFQLSTTAAVESSSQKGRDKKEYRNSITPNISWTQALYWTVHITFLLSLFFIFGTPRVFYSSHPFWRGAAIRFKSST